MIRQLADDLWVREQPLRFAGFEMGTRMSVVRLAGDLLFVHSPVRLDASLRSDLERLGRPRYVVAPNRLHHLFAGDFASAYPEAELFVAPGLEEKRPDLRFAGILGAFAPAWADEIDQQIVHGYPMLNEVAFCHRASRTLLISDLAFNIGPESPLMTRIAIRLSGGSGFGPTLLERLIVRDRAAARSSLERILAWDFDRVILAHGRVLESGGRDALRRGYAWLLPR